MLYRSEVIKKTLNPSWKPLEIAKVRMENPSLRVKVYDWDDGSANDFIGEFNLPDIECLEAGAQFSLIRPKKKYSSKKPNSGTFHFRKFKMKTKKKFLDYVQAGLRLNFSCAIDFTGSNGDPRQPNSLHFKSS